jgi:hypothetical protein
MSDTQRPRASTRERIHVIDAHLAARQKRALQRFVLRDVRAWRRFGIVGALMFAPLTTLSVLVKGPSTASVVATAVALFPVTFAAVVVLTLAAKLGRLNRWVDREFVAGSMLALTLGQHSIRVRDHDSAQEYAYSAIKRVELYRDIVVISFEATLWVLPIELFEPVDLGVLRARAGRTGVPQLLLD